MPSDAVTRSIGKALFLLALVAGLYLRVIDLSGPPYENHSFRQTQTLSTIEDYYRHGIDLLHPKTLYMGYPGTFVLELPVFQALAAAIYRLAGPQLAIVRMLNILFGAGSAWFLYLITRTYFGRLVGIFAAMIYWLAPLNLVYQRSMLIDPSGIFCALACYYLLERLTSQANPDANSVGTARKPWWLWPAFGVATFFAAMIKALYLWPAVLLFFVKLGTRRFRPDAVLVKIFGIFAFSGICFLIWNQYASKVNDTSLFTRGFKPTSLLGVSALFSSEFYEELLMHRSKRLLGGFGLLFFPFGLWAAWVERSRREISRRLWLVILIPPTYLALFCNINRPHDYYQLIIAPFVAIVPAVGLVWVIQKVASSRPNAATVWRVGLLSAGLVLVTSGIYTYRFWYRYPMPDPLVVKFEKLCAGKFEPQGPAMVFVARNATICPPASPIPEFVYAANLWGFGQTVEHLGETRTLYQEYSPGFTNLEYLVFYGMSCPDWVPGDQFKLELRDDQNRLYAFRHTEAR